LPQAWKVHSEFISQFTCRRRLAGEIDARTFDLRFPATFPRFVQHALWRYGAQDGLNVCNGNQIDDSRACENESCPVFAACARVPLRPGRLSVTT